MSRPPNADSKTRRRRSWRRWRQLSLRSLLLSMVLVSLAMWWYLRPEPKESRLLGGLTIRRGVLTEKNPDTGEETLVNHGLAEVVDEHGRVQVRGYFERDEPTGKWTWFDEQGRPQLRGRCIEGRRVGVWTGLYPSGRRRFEVTFDKALRIFKGEMDSYSEEAAARYAIQTGEAPIVSSWREGPARSWWENGVLCSEGSFARNRRNGLWKSWDRGGRLVATGGYLHGIRHGTWHLADAASDGMREVYYVNGIQYAPRDELLGTLTEQLRDAAPERRLRALLLIQAMGVDGLPGLRLALQSSDTRLRHGALGTLLRLGPAALPLADLMRRVAAEDAPLRFEALLACLAVDTQRRDTTLRSLLALAAKRPDRERAELLFRLNELPDSIVDDLEELLDDKDSETRRVAFEAVAVLYAPPYFPASPIPHPKARRLQAILQTSVSSRDPQVAAAARIIVQSLATSLPAWTEGIP